MIRSFVFSIFLFFFASTIFARATKPKKWWREPEAGKPDPVTVLYHTFDGHREDILDWSHHGTIGEFFTAQRFKTRHCKGARMYGEVREGVSSGYRIMPADVLDLKEGTVEFWMVIDPCFNLSRRGVIMDLPDGKEKTTISVIPEKDGQFRLFVGLGGKAFNCRRKLSPNKWYHIAWTFSDKAQKIYIDGKLEDRWKGGDLDASKGLNVGYTTVRKMRKINGKRIMSTLRINGFSGILEDLRIHNRALTDFPGLKKPLKDKNPLRLILDLDFNAGVNNGKMVDRSGMDFDFEIRNLKSDSGKGSSFDLPRCKSFELISNGPRSSMVWLKGKNAPTTKRGTLEIVFKIDKKVKMRDGESWAVMTTCPNADWKQPFGQIGVWVVGKGTKVKTGRTTTAILTEPMLQLRIGYEPQINYFNGKKGALRGLEYLFKPGEWMKVVVAWDWVSSDRYFRPGVGGPRGSKIFINDIPMECRIYDEWGIFTSGGIRFGLDCENGEKMKGLNGAIARFRIYNYVLDDYTELLYPCKRSYEEDLPRAHFATDKKKTK